MLNNEYIGENKNSFDQPEVYAYTKSIPLWYLIRKADHVAAV